MLELMLQTMFNRKSKVYVHKLTRMKSVVGDCASLVIYLRYICVDFESDKFKNATKKFHKLFNVPADEKLVTCQYKFAEGVQSISVRVRSF